MSLRYSRRELLALAGASTIFPSAAASREIVPFVATPHLLVEQMLDLAQVDADDYLIDLGCGDGRIAIAAARRGARSLGVDIDPLRIREAAASARIARVQHLARFRQQDLSLTPIFEASVIALYLLPQVNLELRPRLLTELKPGSRIVSHAFDMGDWRPDEQGQLDGRRIFLWRVPDVAGGRWEMVDELGRLTLLEIEQRFQFVEGRSIANGQMRVLDDMRLSGSKLDFTVETAEGRRRFSGWIDGPVMRPSPPGSSGSSWQAKRVN